MFTYRIRPFLRQPVLFARMSRNAPKCVTEFRRNVWTEELKQNAENEKFLELLPDIVSSVSKTENLKNLPEIEEFAKKLIQYNIHGVKKTQGLMTVTAYQMLEKPENITEESLRLARVLGWCVELIQMCMLFLDDMIDNSSTSRQGFTCWHRLPEVGMRAVNDSSFLIALIFENLKYNFSNKVYYSKLLEVFNEAILQMTIGRNLLYGTARNINLFTDKNYNDIANFTTAYYSFKLPVYVSLLLANRSYDGACLNEEDILSQMGFLTSMQNDYMDCFGDESESGKAGTDIQEGKCTWLAVTALQLCDAEQRAQFAASYGSADAARVRRVRRLYERLRLRARYRDAERAAYRRILTQIQATPADSIIPPTVIRKLFHIAYQICDDSENKQPYF